MLTKLDLCSMALLKLGEKPLASFEDASPAANVARTLYDTIIENLLAGHPWRFARKKYELEKTTDGDFQIPADVLRVIDCDAALYTITGNRIDAPVDSLRLSAISRVAAEDFPPYFASAAAARLAMEFCIPLTNDQNAFRNMAALFESELRVAKFIDSTTTPQIPNADFSLISARY